MDPLPKKVVRYVRLTVDQRLDPILVLQQQHFDLTALLLRQLQCRGESIEFVVDRVSAMDALRPLSQAARRRRRLCCANALFAAPTISAIAAHARMTFIKRYPRSGCPRTASTASPKAIGELRAGQYRLRRGWLQRFIGRAVSRRLQARSLHFAWDAAPPTGLVAARYLWPVVHRLCSRTCSAPNCLVFSNAPNGVGPLRNEFFD